MIAFRVNITNMDGRRIQYVGLFQSTIDAFNDAIERFGVNCITVKPFHKKQIQSAPQTRFRR